MAEYPSTPSFGMAGRPSGQAGHSFYDGSQNTTYSTGPPRQDANSSSFQYNQAQSITGFSPAAVASGVPPLPIYPTWNSNPYAPQNGVASLSHTPELYPSSGFQHPSNRFNNNNNKANKVPSDMSVTRHAHRPGQQAIDEGELNDTESEDLTSHSFSVHGGSLDQKVYSKNGQYPYPSHADHPQRTPHEAFPTQQLTGTNLRTSWYHSEC
jgi:hypothetical protein